ncbi:telomere-binding protein cav-like [Drosophila nasuta]|uniref:telomere-binding protein cav-like n=1 Tax=Drosophila nasuta TaxID=42062 RepID=UPI00295E2AF8|nr:telomere-binding protein cav-like [Drosophila nasuta]
MTRFNCLWEAKKRFEKEDRFKNRSKDFINKMYIKAVEKGIVVPYKPEEIEIAVHIQRCKLKMVNNQRLDKWHRLASQASSTLLPHSPNGSKVKSDTLIISDDSEEDWQAAALEIPNSTMCFDSEMEMHLELSDEDYATFEANVRSTSTPIDQDLEL